MRLTRKSILFLFAVLTLFTHGVCKNIIGVVDVIPLILFHPYMENYIPSMGKFLSLPDDVNVREMDHESRRKLFNTLEKKWQRKARINMGEYVKLEGKLEELLRQQSAFYKEYQSKIGELQSKRKKISRDEFKKELEKVEYYLWTKTKDIDQKIKQIRKRCKSLKEEVASKFYLEGEAHTHRINRIMEDITTGIKVAVKKYKLSFVFNNTFSLNPSIDNENGTDPIKEMLFLRTKKNKTLFDVFGRNKLGTILLKKHKPEKVMDNEIAERYDNIQEYLKLFSNSFYLKTSVIYGGRDITLFVLYYLFNKYNIRKSKRNAYIKSFKKIYNKTLLGGK